MFAFRRLIVNAVFSSIFKKPKAKKSKKYLNTFEIAKKYFFSKFVHEDTTNPFAKRELC